MKILITGGLGYIGSHTVVELCEAGYEPVIVDNLSNSDIAVLKAIEKIVGKEVSFYQIDCGSQQQLSEVFKKEQSIGAVIHFAAFKAVGDSVKEPLRYYRNNLNSLLNVMEVMQEFQTKNLVFSSSCTVYGETRDLPVSEKTTLMPAASPYGNTKQVGERMIEEWIQSKIIAGQNGFKSVILRYFNPIGAHPTALIGELPKGMPGNLVPFITQVAAGIRKELVVFGNDYPTTDGTCVRDFIHVVDLAKAHIKAFRFLQNPDNQSNIEIFNLGMGRGNSVLELIHCFEKVNQVTLNYRIGNRREGDIAEIYASTEKANRLLDWKTQHSLEEALKDAWNWQQNLRNL